MFKKTVTYEDFNGDSQTRDFYFHISKADFLAMAANGKSFQERIERIIVSEDGAAILGEFRALIKLAAGVRSEDGSQFLKDEASQAVLLNSPAFDELLMELATDAKKSSEFVNQLLPEKMQKDMLKQLSLSAESNGQVTDDRPAYKLENRKPTKDEIRGMSRDELAAAMEWETTRPL